MDSRTEMRTAALSSCSWNTCLAALKPGQAQVDVAGTCLAERVEPETHAHETCAVSRAQECTPQGQDKREGPWHLFGFPCASVDARPLCGRRNVPVSPAPWLSETSNSRSSADSTGRFVPGPLSLPDADRRLGFCSFGRLHDLSKARACLASGASAACFGSSCLRS